MTAKHNQSIPLRDFIEEYHGKGLGVRIGGCPILDGVKGGAFGFSPMPKGLKRYYGFKHLHFITCSCYRRLPLLGRARARNSFVKILGEMRDRYGFLLVGYVVMPEHIHLLISEPAKGTPSTVMQVLKQRVSRRLRRKRRRVPPAQLVFRFHHAGNSLPQFWQRRFYDFNVWSLRKKREKLEYMHANPVKRRLVRHPRDWPWSSHLFYEQMVPVLVRIDPTC
jgi:putative transposase